MRLDQILLKANYNKRYFREDVAKVKKISLKYQGGYDYIGEVVTSVGKMDITLYAMRQLLEKLAIRSPVNYLDRHFPNETTRQNTFDGNAQMVKKDIVNKKDIIKDITDLGIRHQANPFKIIHDTNKNEIVGVVAENYNRIPHVDVIESALETYGDDIDPRFSYINDRHLKLYVNSDDERLTPITNQKLLFGYSIGNSETGWASLSVRQALTFLQCTNGLELGRIENMTRFYHTTKSLFAKFQKAMEKHLNDDSLLKLVDTWATKPGMYAWDDLKDSESLRKLDKLLSRFGVNKEEYRQEIMNIIRKEDRTKPLNSFLIGSAVNNFASNRLHNEIDAQALLASAYQVMAIQ